ncbi:MAG: hypothetical protein ACN6O2_01415 [Stenotrophomonas sp.]
MSANEPAYPWGEHGTALGGLTKRELIAAMALQGLLSNPGGPVQANNVSGWQSTTNCSRGDVVNESVQFADALLAELTKEPQA